MKLSDYAKQAGVSYQTAWRWWKSGDLRGYQQPSGTIIVEVQDSSPVIDEPIACIYARVSSSENRDNLDRQAERLVQYATAKGYRIYKVVKEVGSNKKLEYILTQSSYNILVLESQDVLFGSQTVNRVVINLLSRLKIKVEVVNASKNTN